MSHADMGICPNCGEHCDFTNDELLAELKEAATGRDMISKIIQVGIKDNVSQNELFSMIRSMAKDNINAISQILGVELTNKIIAT